MEYSNEYKSRHGFADFENNLFQITSKDNVIQTCKLLKVPTYSVKFIYREKISEGNGWYSYGEMVTRTTIHDFYWLVILNNKCFGVIDENKKSKSHKYAIQDLCGKKQVKEFLKQIIN